VAASVFKTKALAEKKLAEIKEANDKVAATKIPRDAWGRDSDLKYIAEIKAITYKVVPV